MGKFISSYIFKAIFLKFLQSNLSTKINKNDILNLKIFKLKYLFFREKDFTFSDFCQFRENIPRKICGLYRKLFTKKNIPNFK